MFHLKYTLNEQRTLTAIKALNTLAKLYLNQGKAHEAEQSLLYAQAAIKNLARGDHKDVSETFSNLGALYRAQERFEESEEMLQQGLARAQNSDTYDPIFIRTTVIYANLLKDLDRDKEAEAHYKCALAERRKTLGNDHRLTLQIEYNLGTLYQKLGRYPEAKALILRVNDINKRLRPFHFSTLLCQHSLAMTFRYQGQSETALTQLENLLPLFEEKCGKFHSSTVNISLRSTPPNLTSDM